MTLYLVTGGAGFIGSHIVRALLDQGHQVRILDNFSTGKEENIAGLPVEIVRGDIRDPEAVQQALAGANVIFHQAAYVSVPGSMEDPLACFDINVTGTGILLEHARLARVEKVVLASSAAVFGDVEAMPLNEDSELRPMSPYATSKLVNEQFAELYTRLGLPTVALRYFNVYGPRQSPDSQYAAAVPIFVRRLLHGEPVTIFGDGGQTRDLIYVGDVVQANLLAAAHPDSGGQVFTICTGLETRIIDLVETLQGLLPNTPAPLFAAVRSGDIYRSIGTPEKARQMLGFTPQTTLAQGLQNTIDWMKN